MKKQFNILCILIALVCIGCSSKNDEVFTPSIISLKPEQTLVMKYRACHNGCTKGTVKFRNGKAILGYHNLELTSKEIANLDRYFLLGKDEDSRCSLPIEISFKLKKNLHTLNTKDIQIYPCWLLEDSIWPELLVDHLKNSPDEVPYWRLSSEEQSKKLGSITP